MTSFADEFSKARAKGKGTEFEWNGKTYKAYRKGEEPEGWTKKLPVSDETTVSSRRERAPQRRPEPTPQRRSEPSPNRPRMDDILNAANKAERDNKASEREGVRSGVRRVGEGLRNAADTARQLPGRAVERGLSAVGVPSHAAIFAGTVLGNRGKITEENLDDETKAQLRRAAERSLRRGDGAIQYEDYDTPLKRGSLDSAQGAAQTVGRTGRGNVTRQGDSIRVRDKYDFSNEDRDDKVDRYARMGRLERAATVAKETAEDLRKRGIREGAKRIPSRIANAYIGRDSREVDIELRRGGSVKKYASGGRVRGGGIESKGKTKGRFR